jgi:hypothetical protein
MQLCHDLSPEGQLCPGTGLDRQISVSGFSIAIPEALIHLF